MATPRKTRIKVGVIGLGIIGTRVAANLRGAGHQVYVWSRSPHSAPNFLGSVVEVADLCDVIQLFVSDDAALLEVVRTIAAALSPRHVLAAHATVAPATVRQASSIVEGLGARYLDAPFTGSKAAAQNKQLVYYVGGDEAALEAARPVLALSSKKILHVGKVGDATILKIATNMLTATTVQTLAEMQALVRAAGIDEQKLIEALENNASRSGTSDLKLPAMVAGDFEPNFSLKHVLKDARLAMGLAESYKLPLPLMDTATKIFAGNVEKEGWGDLDFSVVAKNYDAFVPPRPAPPAPVLPPRPAAAPPKPPEDAVSKPMEDAASAVSSRATPPDAVKATPPADPEKSAEPPAKDAVPAISKLPEDKKVDDGEKLAVEKSETEKSDAAEKSAAAEKSVADKKPVASSKKTAVAEKSLLTLPSAAAPAAPAPAAPPSGKPAPIGGDSGVNTIKKNTLRVIRDFFKPTPS